MRGIAGVGYFERLWREPQASTADHCHRLWSLAMNGAVREGVAA